jgi:predicted enzyme related to lactoylglutathione lyase
MSARVIHFEIPASDPEALVNFFENTFGWKFQKWDNEPYWLSTTGENNEPGINGAIMKKANEHHHVQNTIGVSDIEDAKKAVETNGGKLTCEIMEIPGIGKLFYFTDPEGNIHGAIQMNQK